MVGYAPKLANVGMNLPLTPDEMHALLLASGAAPPAAFQQPRDIARQDYNRGPDPLSEILKAGAEGWSAPAPLDETYRDYGGPLTSPLIGGYDILRRGLSAASGAGSEIGEQIGKAAGSDPLGHDISAVLGGEYPGAELPGIGPHAYTEADAAAAAAARADRAIPRPLGEPEPGFVMAGNRRPPGGPRPPRGRLAPTMTLAPEGEAPPPGIGHNLPPEPIAAPRIVSRRNPTPGDIQTVMQAAQEYGRKGWPTAERGVFQTTPEAYAETENLVPQVSIKERLPGPLPGEKLPLKERAAPVVENTEQIANAIAERLRPMVETNSPLLSFYDTAPVMRGLQQHAGLSLDEANQFMRDWAGQGAATSPRTQTPPNLRNSSYLQYRRASGSPLTRPVWEAEGNVPGFPMMGMHINLADLFARGAENLWTNPKPGVFRENWSGNLRDVTADTHNIRATLHVLDQLAPGSLSRSWFTNDAAYDLYREHGLGAVDVGDINDSVGDVTAKKVKRQSEYLPMAEPWYRAASNLGIAPARAQSGGWFEFGKTTGLQSPPKTIVNLLNDQIEATAKALGVPPEKVTEWWGRKAIPLAGAAGLALPAFGMARAGLARRNQQSY